MIADYKMLLRGFRKMEAAKLSFQIEKRNLWPML